MAERTHRYEVTVTWTGNTGVGTRSYKEYSRAHTISAGDKPDLAGSADPAFRGEAERWNPEDMLVAALSACHKLWYLHLCAVKGVTVLSYVDHAEGTMVEGDAPGRFTEVVLRPEIRIAEADRLQDASNLHAQAHAQCFIANSVNFPVRCEPKITT
jgi:organic hydroperoxide reductase OsmC/OhrA